MPVQSPQNLIKLILSATVLCSSCSMELSGEGEPVGDLKVVNGDAEPGYDAVGSFFQDGNRCTGTLLSPTVVLTAAHCTAAQGASEWQFVLGQDASQPEQTAGIASLHTHPSYTSTSFTGDDIAIVILDSPLDATPMSLESSPPSVGQSALVVGDAATARVDRRGEDDLAATIEDDSLGLNLALETIGGQRDGWLTLADADSNAREYSHAAGLFVIDAEVNTVMAPTLRFEATDSSRYTSGPKVVTVQAFTLP